MPTTPRQAVPAPLRDSLRTQLWPVPTVGVALAVAAGVGLPRLDAAVDEQLPASVTAYLFSGGAEAARAVLSAVAGSLITVTSLTFSLTVVTLQLASSQFSPRLLRTFTRDRFVHVTLALFLATFSYALTVLRTVRGEDDGDAAVVPQISVTTAFVLAIASVVALVLFLAHLAREIRVETMLDRVHGEAAGAVRALGEHGRPPGRAPVPPPGALPLPARSSGFFVHADEDELLKAALDAGVVVRLDCAPGEFLVAGVPLGIAWPLSSGARDGDDPGELADRVAAAIRTGPERTEVQDLAFGLRQLVDVAVKALSPGVNDPTTARHALGHVFGLLAELAGRDLGPRLLRDEDDTVRVVLHRPGFADLLELGMGQPGRYGKADVEVLAALFRMLAGIAWVARDDEQRAAIGAQLDRLRAAAADQDFDATESERIGRLVRLVEDALAGRWTAGSGDG